jgi:hypothetical protein
MVTDLRDVTGFRGEKIVELCLTNYAPFAKPLFRPGFLGDKWPAIDFYVELTGVRGKRLYFFAQAKSTSAPLMPDAAYLPVSVKRQDVDRLLRIPGPTYIFGVHEPSMRVFVRSVHTGVPVQGITRIPVTHELTGANLLALHEEVRRFWSETSMKPTSSVFP